MRIVNIGNFIPSAPLDTDFNLFYLLQHSLPCSEKKYSPCYDDPFRVENLPTRLGGVLSNHRNIERAQWLLPGHEAGKDLASDKAGLYSTER